MRRALLGTGRVLRLLVLAVPLAIVAWGPAARALAQDLIGRTTYYVTDGHRTLLEVARERGLGILEVSAANPGVDVWVPGAERLITLPTAHLLPDAPREGVVINLAELRLYYFPPGGAVQTYPIGVGREGFHTPIGRTTVVRKQEKPTWYPTDSTLRDKPWLTRVVPPGPDNPLGDYAMYLGWPTYLMHGTNKPWGVGRRVSRGCIRMYPEDVARLYPQVKVGTRVTTLMQPIKLGWHEGELYLEAHPELDQLDQLEETYTFTARPAPDIRQQLLARAGTEAYRIDWGVVEGELVARRGVPTQITRRGGEALPRPAPPPPAPPPVARYVDRDEPPEPAMGPADGRALAAATPDWWPLPGDRAAVQDESYAPAAPPQATGGVLRVEALRSGIALDEGPYEPERTPLDQRLRNGAPRAAGLY